MGFPVSHYSEIKFEPAHAGGDSRPLGFYPANILRVNFFHPFFQAYRAGFNVEDLITFIAPFKFVGAGLKFPGACFQGFQRHLKPVFKAEHFLLNTYFFSNLVK